MASQKTVPGIYKITNLKNNLVYIGSSINISKRWSEHKIKLSENKHENPFLQAAWQEFGQECFKFEIIELVFDKNRLIEREQAWLDQLNSADRAFGYNNRRIVDKNTGTVRTMAQKMKTKTTMKNTLEKNLNKMKKFV